MIANGIINMVLWFYQGLLKLLPINLPMISFTTWENGLDTVGFYLNYGLLVADTIINVKVLIGCIAGIILFELALFSARGVVFMINVLRGSGAKV